LLVDLKSDALLTLDKLLKVIVPYREILFDAKTNKGIKLVISGNRPAPENYTDYPEYIFFDHQNLDDLDKIPLDKVAMVSFPYYRFAGWRGMGEISEAEIERLKNTISKVHSFGKPIRFWGTPDTESAWELFHQIEIDYINTDKPQQVADFFRAKNLVSKPKFL
jgi:alkaline phosphatase